MFTTGRESVGCHIPDAGDTLRLVPSDGGGYKFAQWPLCIIPTLDNVVGPPSPPPGSPSREYGACARPPFTVLVDSTPPKVAEEPPSVGVGLCQTPPPPASPFHLVGISARWCSALPSARRKKVLSPCISFTPTLCVEMVMKRSTTLARTDGEGWSTPNASGERPPEWLGSRDKSCAKDDGERSDGASLPFSGGLHSPL